MQDSNISSVRALNNEDSSSIQIIDKSKPIVVSSNSTTKDAASPKNEFLNFD
jgi:hypothetical protein